MVLLIKLYLPPFPFSVLPKASLSFTLESQTSVEETRQRRVEYFARYIIRVCVCLCTCTSLCMASIMTMVWCLSHVPNTVV